MKKYKILGDHAVEVIDGDKSYRVTKFDLVDYYDKSCPIYKEPDYIYDVVDHILFKTHITRLNQRALNFLDHQEVRD